MKKSKYKSVKTEVDGIIFDSKKEAKRYKELRLLEKEGLVSNLKLQVPYLLCPAQLGADYNGKQITLRREMKYIADFVYKVDGVEVINDAKGYRTKEYKQKKNLMKKIYGIEIYES